MARVSYWNQSSDSLEVRTVEDVTGVLQLVAHVRESAVHDSGRHVPAIEIQRDDAQGLCVAQSAADLYLEWSDPDGSASSGHPPADGPVGCDLFTFDYLGSYSELPKSHLIDEGTAVRAIEHFLARGIRSACPVPLVEWV